MIATIVGSQVGDEGKGGVVDLYGERADVIARYQGGDNAGHTVVHDGAEYKLSLVPSGVLRGKTGVLGNGCVINPRTLFEEIDALEDRGLDPDVRIARRAHVIMPYHRVLDGIEEEVKEDSDFEVGTTGRGIGPTYEDKAGRRGVRVGDLLDPDVLRERLEYVVPQKRAVYEDIYGGDASDDPDTANAFDVDAIHEEYRGYAERIREAGMATSAGELLTDRLDAGENVLLEGAQGTTIDVDHGNYPYVTSSNPTAGYAATGTGLGPTRVGRGEVIGVVKAYLSRVGSGPLPTEFGADDEDLATYIRDAGGEYGTVTGRPRRVGWLDMPMLRHAARANGFTGLAINHVDTLAGLDEVRVGHAYDLDGERVETLPATTERWADCEPEYRTFDGWEDANWEEIAEEGYDALPPTARTYLDYVSDDLDTPIYAVGVGPGREETVVVADPFA